MQIENGGIKSETNEAHLNKQGLNKSGPSQLFTYITITGSDESNSVICLKGNFLREDLGQSSPLN